LLFFKIIHDLPRAHEGIKKAISSKKKAKLKYATLLTAEKKKEEEEKTGYCSVK